VCGCQGEKKEFGTKRHRISRMQGGDVKNWTSVSSIGQRRAIELVKGKKIVGGYLEETGVEGMENCTCVWKYREVRG